MGALIRPEGVLTIPLHDSAQQIQGRKSGSCFSFMPSSVAVTVALNYLFDWHHLVLLASGHKSRSLLGKGNSPAPHPAKHRHRWVFWRFCNLYLPPQWAALCERNTAGTAFGNADAASLAGPMLETSGLRPRRVHCACPSWRAAEGCPLNHQELF